MSSTVNGKIDAESGAGPFDGLDGERERDACADLGRGRRDVADGPSRTVNGSVVADLPANFGAERRHDDGERVAAQRLRDHRLRPDLIRTTCRPTSRAAGRTAGFQTDHGQRGHRSAQARMVRVMSNEAQLQLSALARATARG